MTKKEIKRMCLSAGEYTDLECTLPASAASVLLANGFISDPSVSDVNTVACALPLEARFVAKVEISDTEARSRYIYLRVSGILANAEVFFNGRSYGLSSNFNRVHIFDITDRVTAGENTVEIKCASAIRRARHLSSDGSVLTEYDTPPILNDVGVMGPAEILMTDSALIKGVTTRQEHENGTVNLFLKVDTLGSNDDVRAVASLVSPTGKIYFGGAGADGIKISVRDPELWWPHGFGAPSLYKLNVTLYHGAELVDVYEKKIGLCETMVSTLENGTPAVTVNGIRIFSLGGAYVKENSILPLITKEGSESLLDRAVKAGFNTLAVFDEGIATPESFLDLCDRRGILVWQSLSVPYIAPPEASVFAAGLTAALADTVAGFSAHPSVALMHLSVTEPQQPCGVLRADAIEEFRGVAVRILEPVLNENAPGKVFLPCADELFSHDEKYVSADNGFAAATLYSMPNALTLKAFTDDYGYNLFSRDVEARIGNRHASEDMLARTSRILRFPTGMDEMVYASELSAAEALSCSVKKARMSGNSMSAVLRQFNDGIPSVSSSVTDFFGRPKAAIYYAADFFAPITVCADTCGEKAVISVINGSKKEFSGKLIYALYDTKNKCWFEANCAVTLESGSYSAVAQEDFSRYIQGEKNSYFLTYELYGAKGILTSGTKAFVPVKHFDFIRSELNAQISGSGRRFTIKLTAPSYAPMVHIGFDGIDAAFENNFITLLGATPVMIAFETKEVLTVGELEKRLIITAPYSIGRK